MTVTTKTEARLREILDKIVGGWLACAEQDARSRGLDSAEVQDHMVRYGEYLRQWRSDAETAIMADIRLTAIEERVAALEQAAHSGAHARLN